MPYILPVLLVIALIVLFLLYVIPIVTSIDASKEIENNKLSIVIGTTYGLLRLRTEIPLTVAFKDGRILLDYKTKEVGKKKNILMEAFTKLLSKKEDESLYNTYKKNKHRVIVFMDYIMDKLKISSLNFNVKMGTGDAALTGILYGTIWIAIGSIMTFIGNNLNPERPNIVVVPIFGEAQLSIDFNCIISIKLGHIIYAEIKALSGSKPAD